jgi:hypothetical protein
MPDQPGWGIAALGLLVAFAAWRLWRRWKRGRGSRRAAALLKDVALDSTLITLFEAAVFHFEDLDRDFDDRITTRDLWYVVCDKNVTRPLRLQAMSMLDHWDQMRDLLGTLTRNREQRHEIYKRYRAMQPAAHVLIPVLPAHLRRANIKQRRPRNNGHQWPRPMA